MSSKCRTIDPALFQKGEFRRATYVQREVWIGIISICCDDEGRFEADPWNLSELIFSRAHDATEEQVRQALEHWQSLGWLLLYEDGKYGFLTGWYEHQYIKTPEPSSYPAPPVSVNSWAVAREIKAWFVRERNGNDNSHFRTVIRAYEQSLRSDVEESTHSVRTQSGASEDQNGIERKGSRTEENQTEEQLVLVSPASPAPTDTDIANMARAEKKRRDAERQQQQIAKLDELMATLAPADRALLDKMLAGQEQEKGKPLTSLQQLQQAEIYAKELAEHGPECWHDCCEIACRRSIYTTEFARGCTKNWKPQQARLFRGKPERFLIDPHGVKIWERDWTAEWLCDINAMEKSGDWDAEQGIMRCQYLDANGIPQMKTGKAS